MTPEGIYNRRHAWTGTETMRSERIALALVIDHPHPDTPQFLLGISPDAGGLFLMMLHQHSMMRAVRTAASTIAVGALTLDTGYATPEQIALYLPVTGTVASTATATCRYKESSAGSWTTGHPLYRIRPDLSETPTVGSVPDAFAWTIIDLTPGTSYDVEVTVTEGAASVVKTLTTSTRALPAASSATTKTANSTATIASQFAGLNAGDVLEIADGTYNLSGLQLNRSGSAGNPIYIRGQSRAGTILQHNSTVIKLLNANYVVFERMTLQGSGTDSGVSASSWGVEFAENAGSSYDQTEITFRNMTITGVDKGIALFSTGAARAISCLVYDCNLVGNNTWTRDHDSNAVVDIDENLTWNDDGIILSGLGNCAFNNTLTGFGDSISFASHAVETANCHFFRNDIKMGGDDGTEVDDASRNVTFYDNRMRNTMTFNSLDPLYGGPFLFARNIGINIGRRPFKWNSPNSGQFIYNNTVIMTTTYYTVIAGTPSAEAGWYQPNNGAQDSFAYRNNILIHQGSGVTQTIRLDNGGGYTVVDFDHNAWYPNATFQWPENSWANLAATQAAISSTTPIFSGYTKRHQNDVIATSNPWTTTITLGSDYHTEVTTAHTPTLADGTAPRNAGVAIANVTDGYTGAAPDMGAIIAGRSVPTYGDRS